MKCFPFADKKCSSMTGIIKEKLIWFVISMTYRYKNNGTKYAT
jgi:hypothetical protein